MFSYPTQSSRRSKSRPAEIMAGGSLLGCRVCYLAQKFCAGQLEASTSLSRATHGNGTVESCLARVGNLNRKCQDSLEELKCCICKYEGLKGKQFTFGCKGVKFLTKL